MTEITNTQDIGWKKKYTLKVLSPEFTGTPIEDIKEFKGCSLELKAAGDVEFSFDVDESIDDYLDIGDDNIICVTQSDLDKELVKIIEE
jgi:hypothetical protein